MPRFHFNTFNGSTVLDRDGSDLPSLKAARTEAVSLAGQAIKDERERIASGHDWRLEVTNAHGLLLYRMDFTTMETAATIGLHG